MESVDDDVIRHVVQRCKHLENISLNLCERVSDVGVEALSVALKSGLKDGSCKFLVFLDQKTIRTRWEQIHIQFTVRWIHRKLTPSEQIVWVAASVA